MENHLILWCIIAGAVSFLVGILAGMTVQEYSTNEEEKYISMRRR